MPPVFIAHSYRHQRDETTLWPTNVQHQLNITETQRTRGFILN